MDIVKSMAIAASGMKAQSARMKVISENIANANSVQAEKGGEPYRRRMVTFEDALDNETGSRMVKASDVSLDMSEFGLRYDPNHPAADEQGSRTGGLPGM